MLTYRGVLVMLLASFFLSAGCTPSTTKADAKAREVIDSYAKQYGTLVDFTKLSGADKRPIGGTGYVVLFQAAVTVGDGLYWKQHLVKVRNVDVGVGIEAAPDADILRKEELSANEQEALAQGRPLPYNVTPLPAGVTYVFEGEILFKQDGMKWTYDSWKTYRRSYCTNETPASCYKSLESKF